MGPWVDVNLIECGNSIENGLVVISPFFIFLARGGSYFTRKEGQRKFRESS